MKGYKASYNGVCRDFKFEVGKTYKHDGNVILCVSGFHFCKRAIDTLEYYPYTKNFVLFEVEAEPIVTKNDKSVTNKIQILREVPKAEYFELLRIIVDENDMIGYQEYCDGSKAWFKDGLFHRVSGPAYEAIDGTKEWWINGKKHREGGPAVVWANGTKFWYKDGKCHREDGPASEWYDGSKGWYLDGSRVSETEFNERMKK